MAADAAAQHLVAADEAVFQLLEDPLHDARHAGQNKDIADLEAGRARDRVGQQRRALGHHRHAQPRLVEMARRVMGFEQPLRLGMHDQRHAKGVGDALRGDVVMGRADAAGREHIIEAAPHLVDGGDDHLGIVRDDPRLAQPDAGLVQPLGEKGEVGVLGAAGQDLVADDQDAGGDGLGPGFAGRHRSPRLCPRLRPFIGKCAAPAQSPPIEDCCAADCNAYVRSCGAELRRLLPDSDYRIITEAVRPRTMRTTAACSRM